MIRLLNVLDNVLRCHKYEKGFFKIRSIHWAILYHQNPTNNYLGLPPELLFSNEILRLILSKVYFQQCQNLP